jgi:hypothetical protein
VAVENKNQFFWRDPLQVRRNFCVEPVPQAVRADWARLSAQ